MTDTTRLSDPPIALRTTLWIGDAQIAFVCRAAQTQKPDALVFASGLKMWSLRVAVISASCAFARGLLSAWYHSAPLSGSALRATPRTR